MSRPSPRRWFAIGDAQTQFATFHRVLERQGLLGADGLLAGDVGLVCVGDYFDFGVVDDENAHDVGREGIRILRWLEAHPPRQAVVLVGNHDLARVQELAFETDTSFRAARQLARQVAAGMVPREAFIQAHPRIPTPEVALRDLSAFAVEQRRFVQHLLLSGRVRLAVAGLCQGAPVLLTHAGLTTRDLENAGSTATTAHAIADDLNALLAEAVARVASTWRRGGQAALDLSPLAIEGGAGQEGGGFLYHRPADPERPGIANPEWEGDTLRPRRFDPRALVPGLVQVCGHTSHSRCVKEMPRWTDAETAATPPGSVRTLSVLGEEVRYRMGTRVEAETALHLVDNDMNRVPAETYELLPLDEVYPGSG